MSLLLHLFNYSIFYLYQYGLMDIYFMFWIIIHHYVLITCFRCLDIRVLLSLERLPLPATANF